MSGYMGKIVGIWNDGAPARGGQVWSGVAVGRRLIDEPSRGERICVKVCADCMTDRRGFEREELTIHVHPGRCHLCGNEGDRHATPITLD